MISDLHDIVKRALTSNYYSLKSEHLTNKMSWMKQGETNSSLSYTVHTAAPSVPCHQFILQDPHGRTSQITSIVSLIMCGCSCFTELVSVLLVGGIADTRTPV